MCRRSLSLTVVCERPDCQGHVHVVGTPTRCRLPSDCVCGCVCVQNSALCVCREWSCFLLLSRSLSLSLSLALARFVAFAYHVPVNLHGHLHANLQTTTYTTRTLRNSCSFLCSKCRTSHRRPATTRPCYHSACTSCESKEGVTNHVAKHTLAARRRSPCISRACDPERRRSASRPCHGSHRRCSDTARTGWCGPRAPARARGASTRARAA